MNKTDSLKPDPLASRQMQEQAFMMHKVDGMEELTKAIKALTNSIDLQNTLKIQETKV